ncbi:cobalamin biosynthesis protein CobW [Leptolyngbya sp. 'hensonii']|uniref:CobW family GTP-binding protein n=1 Tax=Leptolyngbya sp. 'hensonii' TaxID=1922337 RepID=UPI0009502B19|nr:GTP-binding protein [Leptolyngbya sp. 'hensonii']OLP19929.1 cobalamin biosynthesis protein CobW [Leptolyngbya sp. 'hensonii']
MSNSVMQVCPESVNAPERVMPVTIITGFLGSGKTTLLNHILNNRHGLKIAVIVNEFGDIDIDSQLLVSVDENMVQLGNGCICCTINQSLVDTVYEMVDRHDSVDYIVVETTGIADPLPIMLSFVSTELRDVTRLDSVLTVVDAESFTSTHYESEAALNQLIFGDIILLNKTDLVSPQVVDGLEDYIRSIKPSARIISTQYGEVPLPLILDIGFNDSSTYLNSSKLSHLHDYEHSHHLENDGFVAVSFESESLPEQLRQCPFDLPKFQNFLDHLSPDVYRAKGIVWFQGSQLRHILQLSGKRCDMKSVHATSLKENRSQSPKRNQLVFIGRNLDAERIKRQLIECLAT